MTSQVTAATCTEQLLYEIGDPKSYKTPDLDLDFTGITMEEVGEDRVRVSGAGGRAPSDFYKVSLVYRDGYFASGQLLVYGNDCIAKANAASDILQQRLKLAGCEPQHRLTELLGAGDGCPLTSSPNRDRTEVV